MDIFSNSPKSCRNESGSEGKLLEDFVDVGDFKIPEIKILLLFFDGEQFIKYNQNLKIMSYRICFYYPCFKINNYTTQHEK